MRILTWLAFVILTLSPAVALASVGDDKPAQFDSPAKLKPGQTGLLKSKSKGMAYFLRVPRKFDPKASARLVVFLHGSNMNGLDYLRSFESMSWADDAILCCPNGEKGTDPFGQNNFTFDSASYVADVTEEVQRAFKPTVTYVGGHSQGGFLTYSVILLFPDLYQGALPMAGDCWMQNEPNLWEDEPKVHERQKEIAIAVIHGKADPVVAFSQGQHAYDCFRAMGWTKLRLYAPEHLEHQFMLSPVDDALHWLDAMNGREPKRSLDLARDWAKGDEWGWVLEVAKTSKDKSPALVKSAEVAAAKAVEKMTAAMKGKPADWVPQWLEFWRVYGASAAAQPLVAKYLDKRHDQRRDGARLFEEARGLLRGEKKSEGYEKLEELLRVAPCTYEAYYAQSWLAERK
ncbi:MAG: hypothetical protein ABIP42_16700 [Planctomycetota bacterium]